MLTRVKITVSYDGSNFNGFQRQKEGQSVQAVIEDALGHLTGGLSVPIYAAGRTDSGVHAEGQVIHADIPSHYTIRSIIRGGNFYMQHNPVRFLDATFVSSTFHARFSARERHYIYRIINAPVESVLYKNTLWHIPRPLCVQSMHMAAQYLVGSYDFSSFRAAGCQARSAKKTINNLSVWRDGSYIYCLVKAPSFLYHQVRNIVGTLVNVGLGKWPIDAVRCVRDACSRSEAGPTAPPQGLSFYKVIYAE